MAALMMAAAVMAAIGHLACASAFDLFLVNGLQQELTFQLKFVSWSEESISFSIPAAAPETPAAQGPPTNLVRVHVVNPFSVVQTTLQLTTEGEPCEYSTSYRRDIEFAHSDEGAFIIWSGSICRMSGPAEHLFNRGTKWAPHASKVLRDVHKFKSDHIYDVTTYSLGVESPSPPLLSLPKPSLQDTVVLAASSSKYSAFITKFRTENGTPVHARLPTRHTSLDAQLYDMLVRGQENLQGINRSILQALSCLDPNHTHLQVPQLLQLKEQEALFVQENLQQICRLEGKLVAVHHDMLYLFAQQQIHIYELYRRQMSLLQTNLDQVQSQQFDQTAQGQNAINQLYLQEITFLQQNPLVTHFYNFDEILQQQNHVPELYHQLLPPQRLFDSQLQRDLVQDLSDCVSIGQEVLETLKAQKSGLEKIMVEQVTVAHGSSN